MNIDRRRFTIVGLATIAAPSSISLAQTADAKFPDIVDVKVRTGASGRFDFDVTVSSPYDTPQRYADAFRVKGRDGTIYGERILLHDHQTEQPFTRDLYGVAIPAGVDRVVVEGRDQKSGWGGKTLEIALPGR